MCVWNFPRLACTRQINPINLHIVCVTIFLFRLHSILFNLTYSIVSGLSPEWLSVLSLTFCTSSSAERSIRKEQSYDISPVWAIQSNNYNINIACAARHLLRIPNPIHYPIIIDSHLSPTVYIIIYFASFSALSTIHLYINLNISFIWINMKFEFTTIAAA